MMVEFFRNPNDDKWWWKVYDEEEADGPNPPLVGKSHRGFHDEESCIENFQRLTTRRWEIQHTTITFLLGLAVLGGLVGYALAKI